MIGNCEEYYLDFKIEYYHNDAVTCNYYSQVPFVINSSWLSFQLGRISGFIGTCILVKNSHGIVNSHRGQFRAFAFSESINLSTMSFP